MSKERLQNTLRQLHDELSQTEGVDPETLARLQAITVDLELTVDREAETVELAADSEADSLKNLLLKFEADHPQLSIAVGRVADALAAMGI